MSLRKQEWLKRLASEGRLYQTITTYDYLVKKARALKLSEKSADVLCEALTNKSYRPLGGNEVDQLLVDLVLEVLNTVIQEDSGIDIANTLRSQGLERTELFVEKLDLLDLKKKLFKLLPEVIGEEYMLDLIWKAAKVSETAVLKQMAPLLKLKNPKLLVKDGESLKIVPANTPQNRGDIEFAGYLIQIALKLKLLPAKSSIESFKKHIKKLTERSMTGFSARYVAIEIKKQILNWHKEFGFCTDSRLARYLDSYVRERVYLFLLKKYDKAGKKEVYQRFMLGYPTLEGIVLPSLRPVGEPCAEKLARTVRGAGKK